MAEDFQQVRAAYLDKHRKHRETRKAKRAQQSREYMRHQKREYRRRAKLPPSSPEAIIPKDWPDTEKAAWIDRLLFCISEGGSVSAFCRDHPEGPVRSVFYRWIEDDASVRARYVHAREMSADTLAEDCIAIADSVQDAGQFDSARVNAARLAVDARKWVASKLKPKTYADRLETVASGSLTVEHKLSDEDRAKVLAALQARSIAGNAPNLIEAQRLIEDRAKDVTPKKTA